MNRTDRLLAIVLELQAHGTRRAEDLAAAFEISKRTVYRDVQALCEAGVPVVAEPGRGYSLVEGYFLPPLRFSADEAVMLLLGADVMAQSFDADYRAAAEAARRKIAGALPAPTRDEVTALRESLRFVPGGTAHQPEIEERLRMLRGAIVRRQTVRFAYTARHAAGDAPPIRQADPLGLVCFSNVWHLVAFDHSRQELRQFRLDRMADLTLLAWRFERPADFRLQRQERDDRTLSVRLLFDAAVARWVRENRSFYTTSEEETPDGLLVTLQVRQERDILQWLLGWGASVRVLAPDSLRALVRVEVEGMLQTLNEKR